jgi:DNA-binding transcriptional LysR family regulator
VRGHEYADLRAFAAIADHGSFSRAAEHLGIAPSTLSQVIKNLEDRLGVALLYRTTRSVSLTAAGARLLARFKPAMAEMEAAISEVRDLGDHPRGMVRLHMSRAAYIALLEPIIGDFHDTYPDVLLDLVIDDAAIDLVAEGFDLSVTRHALIDPSVEAIDIGGDLCHVAAAAPHYLAAYGVPKTPKDLQAHRCIDWRQPGTAHPYLWQFHVDGRWESLAAKGALIVSHCEIAVVAAVAGAGIAFVIEPHARDAVRRGALVPVLRDFLPRFRGWCLCRPKAKGRSAATSAVIAFISHRSGQILAQHGA